MQTTVDSSFTVETPDGIKLFAESWEGSAANGRVLIIVHGMGEYGGRYRHTAETQNLGASFEQIYAIDHRGHGRSTGLRGYAPSFDTFVDDILLATAQIKQRLRQGPARSEPQFYILGHSMGGLIALRLLLRQKRVPFVAAIVSAPFLGLTLEVPAWKRGLGRLLSHSFSKVQLDNEINPSFLSHDPEVVEAYVNDRLVHTKCTPRLYVDMTQAVDLVAASTGPLACPALLLVPGQDKIVSSAATLNFFEHLKDRHKTLKQYPQMYHEVLNEIDRGQVFADIRAWMASL